ncbi:hypothetical protein BGZ76_008890 [Entomortierella beljakovae]|nr:hypothetical protein BGZ76_008890 [Entomortierella beljakovae]
MEAKHGVFSLGQRLDTHAKGDKISTESSGPNLTELELDTNGFYAYIGGAVNTAPPPDADDSIANDTWYLPPPRAIIYDNTCSDAPSTL